MNENVIQTWFRPKEAAKYAGISERLLRYWLKQGLRYSRVGGVTLIKSEWLDEFIESHAATPSWDAEIDKIVAAVSKEK